MSEFVFGCGWGIKPKYGRSLVRLATSGELAIADNGSEPVSLHESMEDGGQELARRAPNEDDTIVLHSGSNLFIRNIRGLTPARILSIGGMEQETWRGLGFGAADAGRGAEYIEPEDDCLEIDRADNTRELLSDPALSLRELMAIKRYSTSIVVSTLTEREKHGILLLGLHQDEYGYNLTNNVRRKLARLGIARAVDVPGNHNSPYNQPAATLAHAKPLLENAT